jgi:hypothetical protein
VAVDRRGDPGRQGSDEGERLLQEHDGYRDPHPGPHRLADVALSPQLFGQPAGQEGRGHRREGGHRPQHDVQQEGRPRREENEPKEFEAFPRGVAPSRQHTQHLAPIPDARR